MLGAFLHVEETRCDGLFRVVCYALEFVSPQATPSPTGPSDDLPGDSITDENILVVGVKW